jgi:hypothetical protein
VSLIVLQDLPRHDELLPGLAFVLIVHHFFSEGKITPYSFNSLIKNVAHGADPGTV